MANELSDMYKRRYSYLDSIGAAKKLKNGNLSNKEAKEKLMDEFNISDGDASNTLFHYKDDKGVWD